MRDDLVVPGEHEENFVLAKDARVVTVPEFTPLGTAYGLKKSRI